MQVSRPQISRTIISSKLSGLAEPQNGNTVRRSSYEKGSLGGSPRIKLSFL